MKQWLGIILIISGIFVGFYIGVWVFFIGGIVDVIEQIRATVFEAKAIAIGVAKVIFAGLAGAITGGILFIIGRVMMDD